AVSRVWGPQPKTDPPAGGEPAVEPAEEQPAASDEKPAQPSSEGEGQGEPAGDPVEQALDVARQGQARGECARFVEAFGDQGGRWFAEGMTFEQARQTYAEGQAEELKRLRTENEQLKRRLEAARGEAEPVEFEPDDPKAARAKRLAEKIGGNLGRVAAGMTLPTSEKPIA
ncbi:MAG TPA: hypothetical protein VMY35_05955, partial [Phycisphaerae bacterium]|nr:hypothetical protein [Phycisphaerae bacterium]